MWGFTFNRQFLNFTGGLIHKNYAAMKTIFLFVCGLFFSALSFAQGSILGFTVEPQSPSESDFVKVYVGLSFTSGDCPLDDKDHSTNGLITDAYTHHCVGMLTVICNTVDTFNLGYLSGGNHKFRVVLSSGAAPPPCTPGIIIDDMDSTSFVVAVATGINDSNRDNKYISIYPNPVTDKAIIVVNSDMSIETAELKILDVFGRTVKLYNHFQTNEIILSRDNMDRGIYFYQVINKGSIIGSGKVIVE